MGIAAKAIEFTERAIELRNRPVGLTPLAQCESFCTFLLIDKTNARRVWRCEKCLRYIEAPVSLVHEIQRPHKQLLLTSISVVGDPVEDSIPARPGGQGSLFE